MEFLSTRSDAKGKIFYSQVLTGMDVIEVDDGSTDNSVQICRQFGARVVKHARNLGQGKAIVTGFRASLMHNYDIIIEMDGDGQHDPKVIPLFRF